MKAKVVASLWLVPLLLISVSLGFSQVGSSEAQLNGSVKDQTGSVIVKAKVSLRNVDTNRVYTANSDSSGFYILTNVPPGNYELSAEAQGFGKSTQSGITLRVGQIATIDIGMKVAATAEQVTVTTEAPVIEPTRTEVSQVIETEQIQSLPISGRLFTDFALLSPGVTTGRISLQSTFTDPSVTRISFAGQRDLNNSVTVDGADNINTATGSQRATPSQEAVSEFRVVNNSFGAEYGRALGGIVNIVTKSGTNDTHGSLYGYLENNAMNANSILTQPGFDTMRQGQFGATLGGAIKKDKTFYFLNYEGQRRAQSPTYPGLLVQNLSAINAMKASLGIAPENLNVLKTADVDNGFAKLDHQFNDKNRLSARYSIQDSTNLNMLVGETLDGGGIGAPSSGRNGSLRDQSLVGTLTTTFSENTVNSALVQWARRNYGFPGTTGQPNLDVPNLLLFGHNFGAFDRYNETRLQFSDTFSQVHGKHFAKYGADVNYVRNFVIWPGFTPARIIFPSLGDMLASGRSDWGITPCPAPLVGLVSPCVAAFFWGAPIGPGPFDPNQASPSVPTTWDNAFLPSEAQNFFVHLNHSYFGFFAQDQWKVTPKLTLNYGLRYDVEAGLGDFIKGDHNNLQPRVGLAWAPDSKTVVRAGYGIFNDKYSLTFFFVPAPQRPPVIAGLPRVSNQVTGTYLLNSIFLPPPCVLPGCPNPGLPPLPLPPGTVPPPLITSAFENLINNGSFPNNALFAQGGTAVDPNLRNPYTEQTSLEVDRTLGKGLTVSLGYMFVAGHKLVRPIDLNVGPPVGKETGTNKDIYNFAIRDPNIPAPPAGSPGTNGIFYFTDSTGNSVYHGMTLQVMEKAGKYFSLNANYTLSHTLDDGTFVTFVSTPQSNAQRNLERANSNQDARHRFVADFVADTPNTGWYRYIELSSIVTMQSARPFTLFVGFDANNDGNPVTDRVGESSRNTYRGDTLKTVDLRLSRAFHMSERKLLSLSFDAFNVLNTTNVDEVFSVYGAPDFIGAPPRHFGDGVSGPSGSVGAPRTVFNPRQLQLGAKFTF